MSVCSFPSPFLNNKALTGTLKRSRGNRREARRSCRYVDVNFMKLLMRHSRRNKKAAKSAGTPFQQDLRGPIVQISTIVLLRIRYGRMKPWSPSKAHKQLHAIALHIFYSHIHFESLSRFFTCVSHRKPIFDHHPFHHRNGHVFRTMLLMPPVSKISNINPYSRAFWSLLPFLQALS